MRARDSFDVGCSLAAIVADAVAIYTGFLLAVWIRFRTGWIPLFHDKAPSLTLYVQGAGIGTLLFLFIFRTLGLYARPQTGTFGDKVPRLTRACGWGIVLAVALAFVLRTEPPFSRVATALSFFTITVLVLLERFVLFRLELHFARHREEVNRVVVIGTNAVAAQLRKALKREPRLRSKVVGFLKTSDASPSPEIPAELIRGTMSDLEQLVDRGEVDLVILADTDLPNERMAEIILCCERALVPFRMIPDLFSILTSKVEVQQIGDIPVLGMQPWPLDLFWNRVLKRAEDIVGSVIGLILSAPIIGIAAVLIKRSSPGPVFFRQERCGERGRVFALYKLRTMVEDAEAKTGPIWAQPDDPRRTPIGAFLRRHNLDELPQFWNVLKGDMSLVGPRPERPCFVEQFKEDISRYMWRHAFKPGMTGWAQVNGLRGQTDLRARLKYDLYYLENWSLAFDFKILVKTFFARENAY
jgi:exopolysaccharide biosynthesis polyprenyl glycosylphosphotransferase